RFDIKNLADAQLIIKKNLQSKVIAVQLANIPSNQLQNVYSALGQFPKLVYIKLLGRGGFNQDEKVNLLIANINKLPQLRCIEFAHVDSIDMDAALKKLIPIKQLRALSFTEYKRKLPASITLLDQIDSLKLNTVNIGSYDLSLVKWQKLSVNGDPRSWSDLKGAVTSDEGKILSKLSNIKSLKRLELDVDLRHSEFISQFTQIEELNIGGGIEGGSALSFIQAVGALKQLRKLSIELTGNNLNISPLANLTQLSSFYLKLNGYPLEGVEAISNFKNLENLELIQCKIGVMPDVFKEMKYLKTVILGNDEITKVPVSLFNLPALENLDLMPNRLTYLPPLISYGCTKLKHVNLSLNQLTSLPQAFGGLRDLETINCSNNKIETIPDGWAYLTHLKEVNFAINRLTEFPEGLQNNHSVERITLFFNNIETFPDVDGEDYKLRYLGITGNRNMFALPEHIGSYTQLDSLEAQYLSLNGLPESLGDCKKLKMLLLTRSIVKKTILPAGLKNAKDLQALYLNDNPLLDHQSIFDLILALPRKNFNADLSSDSIRQLPASKKWAAIPFESLSLRNNLLTTLPVEFAGVPIGQIDITGNEIAKDLSKKFTAIRNKEDMKIIFDMLDIPLPNVKIDKTEYAKSLTHFSINFGNSGQWKKAVDFANKAIATDSVTYAKNALFDVIGICRYCVKDYKGAIKDFDRVINQVKKQGNQPGNPKDVRHFKGLAYEALDQPYEAAKAYATMSSVPDFIEAAKICKQTGNKKLYQQLLDTALLSFKKRMDWNENRNYKKLPDFFLITSNPNTIKIDYAMMLLLGNKPAQALEVLNKVSPIKDWYPQEPSVKYFLLAVANYLINPDLFNQIQTSLINDISKSGKITGYNLVPVDEWLPYTNLPQKQQADLLALQNIAK
ncbi:MAG TPA: leucine-rich repeat domain-containing protein, partial [Mucilaginibacter sp.]|nr:leucine-rich repeat domain-containing protein [Mucilaginibacter sp.]